MSLRYIPVIEERFSKKGGYYAATIPQFPGLLGTGNTIEEAKADVEEARGLYILDMMSENEPIPLPDPKEVNLSIFITGDPFETTQLPQQAENIEIEVDFSDNQGPVYKQPKELFPGFTLKYAPPGSNLEVEGDLPNQAYSSTSAPTLFQLISNHQLLHVN